MTSKPRGRYKFLSWRLYTFMALLPILFFLGTRTGWWTNNPEHTERLGVIVLLFSIPMIILAALAWRRQRALPPSDNS